MQSLLKDLFSTDTFVTAVVDTLLPPAIKVIIAYLNSKKGNSLN